MLSDLWWTQTCTQSNATISLSLSLTHAHTCLAYTHARKHTHWHLSEHHSTEYAEVWLNVALKIWVKVNVLSALTLSSITYTGMESDSTSKATVCMCVCVYVCVCVSRRCTVYDVAAGEWYRAHTNLEVECYRTILWGNFQIREFFFFVIFIFFA